MPKPVKNSKLQSYKILEAFVQCNFLDGFSYIDKAGEIVNSFVREKEEIPQFQMGLEGLILHDVSDTVSEVKVSSTQVWIHFVDPKNLGNVSNEATELLNKIVKILKPTLYKRIGWRTYFARDFSTTENPIERLRISKSIPGFDLNDVVLAKQLNGIQVRTELSPLKHASDSSRKAILFDIDLGKEIKALDAKAELATLWDTYKSDELLDSLEELLENG